VGPEEHGRGGSVASLKDVQVGDVVLILENADWHFGPNIRPGTVAVVTSTESWGGVKLESIDGESSACLINVIEVEILWTTS
jgi:hypothetical protein